MNSKVISKFLYYFNQIRNKDSNICWIWPGPVNRYGRFMVDYQEYAAHRISYLYHNNMIQSEFFILHKPFICKRKDCINPKHLYEGTQKDNLQDAVNMRTHDGFNRKGSKSPNAIINEAIAYKILFERDAFGFTQQYLANKYNISLTTVNLILNRKAWKHVKYP
jgi:hypothetical protein